MSNLPKLAADLTHALDPVAFARDRLAFSPDPDQAAVLASRSKLVILNCTRQWGKSTVTAARAVFTAWHYPDSLTLVLSPGARQSSELVRKAAAFLMRLDVRPRGDGHNQISLLLPNGARIVGLPGTEATVRGFSAVQLLLIDEAARVPQDLYLAMSPVLAASDGDLWLLSTPNGRRGFFFDAWNASQYSPGVPSETNEAWLRLCIPATECPRIHAHVLERHRRTMGDRWFRQEYLCEFVDTDQTVFPEDIVDRSIDYAIEPIFK